MYDVSGFRPQNEKTATLILIVFIMLVVAGSIGYMFGIRNAGKPSGTDVSDNGNRIDDVREQYHTIEVNQHQLTDGIKQAAGTAESIAKSSEAITGTAGNIAGGIREAGAILDECQQIIGTIRNRGQKGKAAH